MRHPVLQLMLIAICLGTAAHSQDVAWSRLRGSYGSDRGTSVAVDGRGNIYVACSAYGDMDGQDDKDAGSFCLLKYDASGKWLWTRRYGLEFHGTPEKIAIDRSDNLYVAGSWCPASIEDTAAGEKQDFFLCKIDSGGGILWNRIFGSKGYDLASSLAVGAKGDIYVTGEFRGAWEGRRYRARGDLILAKYGPDGKQAWIRNIGDSFLESMYDLALDGEDNIYLSGLSVQPGKGPRSQRAFLTLKKYDNEGASAWNRDFQGSRFPEYSSALAVDSHGNAYLTGVTFHWLSSDSTSLGDPHGYLMKVDSLGNFLYAKLFESYIIGSDLALEANGDILMAGESTVTSKGFNLNGNRDLFFALHRPDGTRRSIRFWGTRFDEWLAGMTTDGHGAAFVVGHSEGSPGGQRNTGGSDILLVKVNPKKVVDHKHRSFKGAFGTIKDN